jgi:hypothetical protein
MRIGQRQVPALRDDLMDGVCLAGGPVGADDCGQQGDRVVLVQHVQRHDVRGLKIDESPSAGDQGQALRGSRQQRPNLRGVSGVVQQDEHRAGRQFRPPARGAGVQVGGDLLARHTQRPQQRVQRRRRRNRRLARGVAVQVDEQLGVGIAFSKPVCGMHGQGRLANAGHPIERLDDYRRRPTGRHAGGQQFGQLGSAAGEVGDVTGQVVADRVRNGCGQAQEGVTDETLCVRIKWHRPTTFSRCVCVEQVGVDGQDLLVQVL